MIRAGLMMLLAMGASLWAVPLLVVSGAGPKQGSPQQDAAQKFRKFLDEDWKLWMEQYPEMATSVGYPGQNARWTDDSPAGIDARKKHLNGSLRR